MGIAAFKQENDKKLESKGYSFIEFEEHKFAVEGIKQFSGRSSKNVFKTVSSSNKILIADLAIEKIDALKKKEKLKKIQKEKADTIKAMISNKKIIENKKVENLIENTIKEDDKESSDDLIDNEDTSSIKEETKVTTTKRERPKADKLGRGARQREKKKSLKLKLDNEEISNDE